MEPAKCASEAFGLVQPLAMGTHNSFLDKSENCWHWGFFRRRANDKHSLAYMEMRLIFACLLYFFDFTQSEPHRDLIDDQLCFGLWERVPLKLHMGPVG